MVTDAQRHKLNRDPVRDAHLILLEFQEDGRTDVHRACVNNEDIVSNGETFSAFGIEVSVPDSSESIPSVQLSMSNIDRQIGKVVSLAKNRIGARLMLIDASVPDIAIIDTKNSLTLGNVSGNSERISGTLGPRMDLQEPIAGSRVSEQFFPGIYYA